jgi:hypothetical protein
MSSYHWWKYESSVVWVFMRFYVWNRRKFAGFLWKQAPLKFRFYVWNRRYVAGFLWSLPWGLAGACCITHLQKNLSRDTDPTDIEKPGHLCRQGAPQARINRIEHRFGVRSDLLPDVLCSAETARARAHTHTHTHLWQHLPHFFTGFFLLSLTLEYGGASYTHIHMDSCPRSTV